MKETDHGKDCFSEPFHILTFFQLDDSCGEYFTVLELLKDMIENYKRYFI